VQINCFGAKLVVFMGIAFMGIATVEDDEAVLFGKYAAPGTPPPPFFAQGFDSKEFALRNGAMI
jgi:hypothetical protein